MECMGAGRLQRGAALGIAAAAIGILTTLSGVVIELASDMLADLRHGVCVERLRGDTRPLWVATFGGGWRPYDRMRCCGGSSSVDQATEECRAVSIITHTTRKHIAVPLRTREFGRALPDANGTRFIKATGLVEAAVRGTTNSSRRTGRSAAGDGIAGHMTSRIVDHLLSGAAGAWQYSKHSTGELSATGSLRSREQATRAARVHELVGADATRVRMHMSNLFALDPAEHWMQEAIQAPGGNHVSSLTAEAAEIAVNAGVAQTQSESAGSLAPIYEWVPWERALMARGRSAALCIYVAGSGLLALCAACVTLRSPAAKGSGIPEVKASVAGFALPQSFRARTLAAKVAALSLCVGAGMAVGKEGPMIHIGACWGVLLFAPISRLGHLSSPVAETELVCVGAAAGVAAAFGAPLAGVLFAVEELGTTMPTGLKYSTMLCAFGSAVVAAMTLKWLDLTRTQRLTLFEVDYKQAWDAWEAIPFCLLGILGGLLGGAFVQANAAVHRRRLRAQAAGSGCWFLPAGINRLLGHLQRAPSGADSRVLEVVLLAVFTGVSNYPHTLTRMLQNDAIKSLFSQCPAQADSARGSSGHHASHDPVGLCGAADAEAFCSLLRLLAGALSLRFLQTVATFGALTPAGLFVPSLYMGGCVGRGLGAFLKLVGMSSAQGPVEPGIYAMVGAGAMLAGVSRLTLSLAVVLFELTGGLTYIVPFMLAVLIAKWTGDVLTSGNSVYDMHAELNGLAKVEQLEEQCFLGATLQDLDNSAAGAFPGSCAPATHSTSPALWATAGLARGSDLLALCREVGAGHGFVVLSLDSDEGIEVLGWARSDQMLKCLASTDAHSGDTTGLGGKTKMEAWLRLSSSAPAHPWGSLWQGSPVVDFVDALEARGAVRVRADCPVQTAHCIFQRCPAVRALVSVDGATRTVRAVTRGLFVSRFVPASLGVQPPPAPMQPSDAPSTTSKGASACRPLDSLQSVASLGV